MGQPLLQQQIDYYRARADEYDQWFFRQGRYDRGEQQNDAWFREIALVRKALAEFDARGEVLELAGGTGLWTERLAATADHLTVIDASPEVLAINRLRVKRDDIDYIEADLLQWKPPKLYDIVFFSFWLSHVPPEMFGLFWSRLEQSLKPGGRVFLIDSRFDRTSTAADHVLEDKADTVVTRKLNDGREFQIVKVFYDPEELSRRLQGMGWDASISGTDRYFLYGSCLLRHK